VAKYAHALDELNVPELEAVLTEDTTWTFTMPGQALGGELVGPAAGVVQQPSSRSATAPA
jgi:hypothetical protein